MRRLSAFLRPITGVEATAQPWGRIVQFQFPAAHAWSVARKVQTAHRYSISVWEVRERSSWFVQTSKEVRGDVQSGGLSHEFELLAMWYQVVIESLPEESPDGFPAALAIIQGPMINIHSDELVGQVSAHIARILQRVLDCLGPVFKAETDAGGQDIRDLFADRGHEAFVDDVAAQRQRQAVVYLTPPHTQVLTDYQPFLLPGKLAFMNNQPHIGSAGMNGVENAVEWNNQVFEFGGGFAEP